LVVHDSSSVNQCDLYDFSNKVVLGTISIKDNGDFKETRGIAAEPGYGPLIIEIGIMSSFDKPLLLNRSGDVRQKPIDIWAKFIQNGEMVSKEIEPGEKSYSNNFHHLGEELSRVANTALLKPKSSEYKALELRGAELMSKWKISSSEVKQNAGNYFIYKYTDY
jgi:hypothetical protein